MIKIRPNSFETNSSSQSNYYDCDELPKRTTAHQKVCIILSLDEDMSDKRENDIFNEIEDGKLSSKLFEVFGDFYEDCEDAEVYDCDDGDIRLQFKVTCSLSWNGTHTPASRHEPAEYPEAEIEEHDGVPLKNESFKNKDKIIENLMNIFAEAGYKEILGIDNVYADPIDENEAISNIRY